MLFNLTRKTNYGPNVGTTPTFDPTNPLCSPGVAGASFIESSWAIELNRFSEIQNLSEQHGAVSVIFRPGTQPTIVILERETPQKASA